VLGEKDPQRAVRELLLRTLSNPSPAAERLGKDVGGIEVLYNAPDLTLLNVIWAPQMSIMPHEHRMWAVIGIYGGTEDNTLYKRGTDRIQAAGGRTLHDSDVLALGDDAIHSVANPESRFTGAIHIYGGDFVNQPRSQWDPDTLMEEPYNFEDLQRRFRVANEDWAAQVGQDLNESAT
jgi:predicted metal-dependent enzyme (double-stranded beta helix superfamily)